MQCRSLIVPLVLLAATVSFCCAPPAPFGSQQVTPASAKPKLPTIVTVTGRNESLTISAAPGKPRYSVSDKAGHTMLTDATGPELAKQHPHLHRLLDANAAADRQAIADIDRE
jgi:hypothetical protein